jgi:hypothetical protein
MGTRMTKPCTKYLTNRFITRRDYAIPYPWSPASPSPSPSP